MIFYLVRVFLLVGHGGRNMGVHSDPTVAAATWSRVLGSFQVRSPWYVEFPNSREALETVGMPADAFVHPSGRKGVVAGSAQAPWASLTGADGPASRLYLSLVAFAQVAMPVDSVAKFTLRHDSTRSNLPQEYFLSWSSGDALSDVARDVGINLLIGRTDRLQPWTKCLSEALDRLRAHSLMSPRQKLAPQRPLAGGKSVASRRANEFEVWTGRSKARYTIERPIKFVARGYNEPKAIPVPLGFFTNGWCAHLTGKETHTLFALLYEYARQPTRSGHFVAPKERDFLGIVDKSYQRALVKLVDSGFIVPVDALRFNDRKGKGARHDLPHEFNFDFSAFAKTPTV